MYGKRRMAKIVFACKLPNARRNLRVRVGRERDRTDGGRVSVLSLKRINRSQCPLEVVDDYCVLSTGNSSFRPSHIRLEQCRISFLRKATKTRPTQTVPGLPSWRSKAALIQGKIFTPCSFGRFVVTKVMRRKRDRRRIASDVGNDRT